MEIEELVRRCQAQGGSDLHLVAGLPPLVRVWGDLRQSKGPVLSHPEIARLLQAMMTPEQQAAYERGREVDFALAIPGQVRLRIHAYRQRRGQAAALRLIQTSIPSLQELGMDGTFQDIAMTPRGLVCVTGPTGSGKSTTLAALLDVINAGQQKHILTIEDPIEFLHENKNCLVTQREIGRDSRSFPDALRAALRADPDVLLVGELRDRETIALALTAAETGHLVFATLHAASAAQAVDRMVAVFPAREKDMARIRLSESLQAVVAQILLCRIGGGRIAAREILIGTAAVRNLIRENRAAQLYSAMQSGRASGMRTLDQSLQELLAEGLIEAQSAVAAAVSPRSFQGG